MTNDAIVDNPRRLTKRIKTHLEALQRSLDEIGELIAEAYQGRVWEPLGYTDWDTYVREEFASVSRLRLTRDERRDMVVSLRSVGMSTRAIGGALGVSHTEVQRSAGTNVPPAPVTGLDGKEYAPQVPHRVPAVIDGEVLDETESAAPSFVDRDTGEALQPSSAVTEFLDSDADLQRARYRHEFMKVLCRSDDFMEFDPVKLGAMADRDLIEVMDNYLTNVRHFIERFHESADGLRVMNGGRQ